MSSKSFKCVLQIQTKKLLLIKRLLWKPEAAVRYSRRSCIGAEFGQSWLCFTRQQGLTRSNATAGSGLICGRAGRKQRHGPGPTWLLRRGVGKGWVWSACVCMCAAGNKADLSFSSQLKPSTLLLHCLQSASALSFPAPPLLHPELRHVTWRWSWSDWVTGGRGACKVCCLACSYFSFFTVSWHVWVKRLCVIVSKINCRPVPIAAWHKPLTSSKDVKLKTIASAPVF